MGALTGKVPREQQWEVRQELQLQVLPNVRTKHSMQGREVGHWQTWSAKATSRVRDTQKNEDTLLKTYSKFHIFLLLRSFY